MDEAVGRERVDSEAAESVQKIVDNLAQVVHATDETLRLAVLCLVAEGHLIIEDFPGVGKTMLAKALARSIDCSFSRLQFTPDLLPSDVTGVNVFNQRTNEFEFRPGPVFANLLLVDEINRASPKTQAALLEAMQENQVTVDGVSYELAAPFMVIATQNPIEYEGTYPLPEAQLDRFALRIDIGYPPLPEEARMLTEQTSNPPLESLRPVATAADVRSLSAAATEVFVEESVNRYVVALLRHTRSEPARGDCAPSCRQGARARRRPRLRLTGRRQGLRRARARPPPDRGAGGSRCRPRAARPRAGDARAHARSRMTHRGRLALVLGAATYLGAWAFGSKILYPVALGLPLAVLLGWLWTALANRPLQLRRTIPPGERLEGDDVKVGLELVSEQHLVPARWTLREQVGRLGERVMTVGQNGRARYILRNVPRGRYEFQDTVAVIEDPFGLERVEQRLDAPGALLVYPRLVELDRLFSDAGSRSHDGRRLLLRRPSGFDLHSVREYEHGDSLRKVHWRSTARRAQLMVKELEDAPRDEVAIVLDADPEAVVGESFDVQVRAAGSLLLAHVRRGRRALLVINGAQREHQGVRSGESDWRAALDLLAAAEPEPGPPLAALLADENSSVGRALELCVVTASLPARLVERLVDRALGSGHVSLVLVDPSSFAGTEPTPRPELLRLQAAGVALVVVRAGDDLGGRLGDVRVAETARA